MSGSRFADDVIHMKSAELGQARIKQEWAYSHRETHTAHLHVHTLHTQMHTITEERSGQYRGAFSLSADTYMF